MQPRWLLIVLTALATACAGSTQPASDVLLPKLAPLPAGVDDMRLTALLVGRLVVDQGCVKVDNSGHMVTVLWHNEVELVAGSNPPMLRDTSTARTYRIGEQVRLGGGESDPAHVERKYPEIGERC